MILGMIITVIMDYYSNGNCYNLLLSFVILNPGFSNFVTFTVTGNSAAGRI